MRVLLLALASVFSVCDAVAGPQSGLADPAFGNAGQTTVPFDLHGFNSDEGQRLTVDASGRLYLIGLADASDSDECLGITRLLSNGTPDGSYGIDGRRCHAELSGGLDLAPMDAVVLPDGRLLVAGVDALTAHTTVCGFDSKGNLDMAGFGEAEAPGCLRFNDIDVFDVLANAAPLELGTVAMAVGNGLVYLAIQVKHDDLSLKRVRLVRITFDGSVIPYGIHESLSVIPGNDPVSYSMSDLILDEQGRLVLAGAYAAPNDLGNDFYVARIDAGTGKLDPSFNGKGIRTVGFDRGGSNGDAPAALARRPNGQLLVAGAADTKHGLRPAVLVLDEKGKIVPSFNAGKPAVYDPCVFFFGQCDLFVTAAAALSAQRTLLAGYAIRDGIGTIFTMRLDAKGMPDATYGTNFPGQTGFVIPASTKPRRAIGLVMQADKPVLGGWESTLGPGGEDFLVTRLNF